ncbi:VanZ family protein [Streptomyces carminius]|uniref:VanZ family protein n=1 Tax=Streptomyces carminius TaxID=2665496 RepID=A0A2M8LPS9_9ACTN|nr:VanZ family protein [Streptomyces carminius]PJE93961.1 VanZ family protein [Streptomyces carminius]
MEPVLSSATLLPALFLLYLAVLGVAVRRGAVPRDPRRLLLFTVFAGYVLGVLHFTLLPVEAGGGPDAGRAVRDAMEGAATGPAPDPETGGVNLSPLTAGGVTFWLNILMTVPLGFLLPLLSARWGSALRIGLCGAAVSLGIELTQLLLLALGGVHVVDVNDLIANTSGALLGYLLFRAVAGTRPARALRPASPAGRRRPPHAPAPTGRRGGPGGR